MKTLALAWLVLSALLLGGCPDSKPSGGSAAPSAQPPPNDKSGVEGDKAGAPKTED